MTTEHDQDDALTALIRDLRIHDVGPRRAARLRAYAHAKLLRPAEREDAPPAWVPAALASVCVLYVIDIIMHAAALYLG